MTKKEPLVVVTPVRGAVDKFIRKVYPGIRIQDVVWIRSVQDLYKVRSLELKFERVHFLHRSYEIENAREEIVARVIDYPVKQD